MEYAKQYRKERIVECMQMTKDNNTIHKLVEENNTLIRNMAYKDLTKLECTSCVKKKDGEQPRCLHYIVNDDERCRQVVYQYELAQKDMFKNVIKN